MATLLRPHPDDSVAVALTDLSTDDEADGTRIRDTVPQGTRSRSPTWRRVPRFASTGRSSAWPRRRSRQGSTFTPTISGWARCRGTTPSALKLERVRDHRARDVPGHRAPRRPGRHPQLHRHPDLGELLGHGGPRDRRTRSSAPAPGRLSRTSTAWSPLAHGTGCGMAAKGEGSTAAAHAGGLRRASQLRRRAGGRPGLRGLPDRRAGRRLGLARATLPHDDHPGRRRHAQDRRGRRRARSREMLPRAQRVPARAGAGRRARARPAMRRLRRLFGHHRQPGAGRGGRSAGARTAAPPSCRRRRRSTAPSIC